MQQLVEAHMPHRLVHAIWGIMQTPVEHLRSPFEQFLDAPECRGSCPYQGL